MHAPPPSHHCGLGRVLVFAAICGVFVGTATYHVGTRGGPAYSLRAMIAVGLIGLALAGRTFVGVGAARAAAFGFAPASLWFFYSAERAQDPLLAGEGLGCGTGLIRAVEGTAMGLMPVVMVVAVGTMLWSRRARTAERAPHGMPALVLAAALAALLLVGLVRAIERPSAQALRASFETFAVLTGPGISANPPEHIVLLDTPSIAVVLDCLGSEGGLCRVTFDLHDGLGARSAPALDPVPLSIMWRDDYLRLQREPTQRVWRIDWMSEDDRLVRAAGGVVAGVPGPLGNVRVADLPAKVGPPWESMVLAASGALFLIGVAASTIRARRRLVRVLHREARIVALVADLRQGYRVLANDPPEAVQRRSGADLLSGHVTAYRDWQALAFVVALQLALPLIAAVGPGSAR